jgi:hypothetical protein
MPLTIEKDRDLRRVLVEKITSGDRRLEKEAQASIDKFIRQSYKEHSYSDKILEPQKITSDDFYPQLHSDKPAIMLELEPECPGVFEMAYNTPAPLGTFGARRTLISLDRIKSTRLKKEVNELTTWSVSLRDIFADFQLKEILFRCDMRFMGGVNLAVGTVPNQRMELTNSIHYRQIHDGMTRNAYAESLKYIPRLGRRINENGLQSNTLLMNTVTRTEFAKWQYFDTGGDFTSGLLKNGLQELNDPYGMKILATIKRGLVRDGEVYHFGDPNFIGRSYVHVEPTMIIKQHDHTVEFSVFTERTGGIFVFIGVAKVEYTGVKENSTP